MHRFVSFVCVCVCATIRTFAKVIIHSLFPRVLFSFVFPKKEREKKMSSQNTSRVEIFSETKAKQTNGVLVAARSSHACVLPSPASFSVFTARRETRRGEAFFVAPVTAGVAIHYPKCIRVTARTR